MPRAPKPSTSATSTATGDQPAVIVVDEALAGGRLDRALATVVPGLSRTRAQAAIESGRVTVDGKPAKSSLPLEAGMRIELAPEPRAATIARAGKETAAPPLRVVFEDAHILVVDKPAGVVVHPAPGHTDGTLVDALLAHEPGIEGGDDPTRPGIVHRLDKDTSGLLVIAKTAAAHAALAEQMRERRMVKRYLALVEGQMRVPEGVIEAPIGRDPRRRQRMAVISIPTGGREARTRFRVLRTTKGRSLLELQLETGRTHQIRVHLAAVHHPVVGDVVYGRSQPPQPPRQFLHAAHLELAHPVSGEWMVFDSPLPDDLATFLASWER